MLLWIKVLLAEFWKWPHTKCTRQVLSNNNLVLMLRITSASKNSGKSVFCSQKNYFISYKKVSLCHLYFSNLFHSFISVNYFIVNVALSSYLLWKQVSFRKMKERAIWNIHVQCFQFYLVKFYLVILLIKGDRLFITIYQDLWDKPANS